MALTRLRRHTSLHRSNSNRDTELREPKRLTEAKIYIRLSEDRFKPTDAFGEITFEGSDFVSYLGKNPSQYVRLHEETKNKDLLALLRKDWRLGKPNLLISVTGGAKDFKCDGRVREVFSKGIVEAAVSTNGWIVTGGTNGGVMKYVGEAVANYQLATGTTDAVAIGIATWGVLNRQDRNTLKLNDAERSTLEPDRKFDRLFGYRGDLPALQRGKSVHFEHHPNQNRGSRVCLDPNHTHFILVDDMTEGEYGVEIKLRGRLESAISKEWNVQHNTTDVHIPVVCIAIEGGPNTIETVYEAVVKNDTPVLVVANTGRAANFMARVISNHSSLPTSAPELRKFLKDESAVQKAMNQMEACLAKPDLLSVYHENSGHEMDTAILKALVKAESNTKEQLMLSLNLNRVDIAKSEIFEPGKADKLEDKDLSEAFQYALVNNRHEFVKLILDEVNLSTYQKQKELKRLYNSMPVTTKSLLRPLLEEVNGTIGKEEQYTLEDVGKVIQRLTTDSCTLPSIYSKEEETGDGSQKTTAEDYIRDLFLFAVLNNFEEMAYIFWDEGQESIAAALTASKIYKSMADLKSVDPERRNRLLANASKYEDLAFDILTQCKENPGTYETSDLLTRVMPNWGETTCLSLAESAENLRFLSHPAVQDLLQKKWQGKLSDQSLIRTSLQSNVVVPLKLWLCTFLPFLIPFLVNFRKENAGFLSKIWWFYESPRMIFRHNMACHILFLILFSYNMLWGGFPSSNPTVWELLLMGWVITLITEEIRQMIQWESKSPWSRFKGWASSTWNSFDAAILILFCIGTGLGFANIHNASRILLAFDLFLFYCRLLEYLTLYKSIGPKVIIIGRMFIDLAFFLCILFIILVGYGITVHIILYPHVTEPSLVIERILYRPYFQIYGELFLDDLTGDSDVRTCAIDQTAIDLGADPCPENPRIGLFLLAMYMMFSNVLLLNLLIAMFSYTFNSVQEKTDLFWKFQRYTLTKEYVNRPMLAPPLIILSHIWQILLACLCCCSERESELRRRFPPSPTNLLVKWEERQARLFTRRSKQKQFTEMFEHVKKANNGIQEILRKLETQMNNNGNNA